MADRLNGTIPPEWWYHGFSSSPKSNNEEEVEFSNARPLDDLDTALDSSYPFEPWRDNIFDLNGEGAALVKKYPIASPRASSISPPLRPASPKRKFEEEDFPTTKSDKRRKATLKRR
ncbi:hypothetical protein LTR37_003290 [Vermiconidia calcicola]|uniref:Uncharacterized protein n=1 Tax=Vermiconidia calcicola TaxID=1690605 RepID=A0ACC3NRM4_9PEZI|nr:hypothetical protein LTR37_003290 [Vermiconidia calcicola]